MDMTEQTSVANSVSDEMRIAPTWTSMTESLFPSTHVQNFPFSDYRLRGWAETKFKKFNKFNKFNLFLFLKKKRKKGKKKNKEKTKRKKETQKKKRIYIYIFSMLFSLSFFSSFFSLFFLETHPPTGRGERGDTKINK